MWEGTAGHEQGSWERVGDEFHMQMWNMTWMGRRKKIENKYDLFLSPKLRITDIIYNVCSIKKSVENKMKSLQPFKR